MRTKFGQPVLVNPINLAEHQKAHLGILRGYIITGMTYSQGFLALAGALLIVLIQVVLASQQVVIDDGDSRNSNKFNQLCHGGQNLRMTRASTIPKLQDFFEVRRGDAFIKPCVDSYIKPLAELKSLFQVSNENVCSYDTMKRLDHFHWHYIVGSLSKKWRKASKGKLPELLKIFFMNYANEVTERCKDTLARRLELSVGSNAEAVQAESLMTNKFGLIINQLGSILHPRDNIKKHDDFLLIFDHLADKERKKGNYVEQPVDLRTEDQIMMSFKVKDPEGAWAIQKKCRQELRPIYRDTVLPVMRLISIGYGNEEKRPRDDVADNDLVKNWYAITQFCQLVLPVNFYQDRMLQTGQVKAITEEEARELLGMKVDGGSGGTGASVFVKPEHLGDKLAAINDQIVQQVKLNIKRRGNIYGHVLRNVFTLITGQLKSKLKNLFFSKKVETAGGDEKFVVESGDVAVTKLQAASETNEAAILTHDDDDDDDDDVGTGAEAEAANDDQEANRNKRIDYDEDTKADDAPKVEDDQKKVAPPGFFKRNRTQLIVGTALLIGFGLAAAFVVYLFWTSVVTMIGVGASLSTISFGR